MLKTPRITLHIVFIVTQSFQIIKIMGLMLGNFISKIECLPVKIVGRHPKLKRGINSTGTMHTKLRTLFTATAISVV